MVGAGMTRHKAWDDVILKLQSRLSKWKAKTLSIGGRLTLLKSVLGASPLYNMSIFKVPKGVLKGVLASKKKGGLGVSSYFALNRALLLKWVWRFVSQDDSLWFRVIQAVHGDKIDSHSVRKVSIWSSILKEVQVLKSSGFDFLSYCSKRIGDGQSTSFWKETWMGDIPLCELCPRLFALDSAPNICVAAKMAGPLDTSFRRSVRGGVEQQEFSDLSSFLNSVVLSTSNDRWYFSLSSSGEFSVKDTRLAIDDLVLPSHSEPTRWVKLIPIKINVFMWRARRGCLPTRYNLVQKGVILESTSCPVCFSDEEDVHHLLFRCSLSQEVLHRVCRWWEIDFQLWRSFSEWDEWFSSIRLPGSVKGYAERLRGGTETVAIDKDHSNPIRILLYNTYFENLSYDSKGHYVNVGEKLKILNLVISMIALSGYTEGINVYVDNIDVDVTEDLLRENFNHCGKIT
ncbi:RNA-directed DNA polymerase, eukaryota [Tanacetum coccineum]